MIATINLPVECIHDVVNVDNPCIRVPLNEQIADMDKRKNDKFRSIFATFKKEVNRANNEWEENSEEPWRADRRWPAKRGETQEKPTRREYFMKCTHDLNNISLVSNFVKKPIVKTYDLEYYKLTVRYCNGIEESMIVPTYVRFYSTILQSFINVKFLKTAKDVLLDYTNDLVQIISVDKVEDFNPTEYYQFQVMMDSPRGNFFLNGLLVTIPFNNFELSDKDEEAEEEESRVTE